MISFISTIWNAFFEGPKEEFRILIGGLRGSGKTSILYQIKYGKFKQTTPTVGVNVESIELNENEHNIELILHDMGNNQYNNYHNNTISRSYRQCFDTSQGLIFVLDSSKYDHIDTARKDLQRLLQQMTSSSQELLVLILANKQDLTNAMSASDLSQILDLQQLLHPHEWCIAECNAIDGDGINQGLDWLTRTLVKS